MSTINDGGPAFPPMHDPNTHVFGMTLRDYFAAKAMPSVWADIPDDANREQALEHLGRLAYEMADAMLKARKEGSAS